MIDRIIENWLDNASEKTYQIPFCYMLVAEGHTVLHLTRHCAMEHGKDVITIDPKGNVCAYQLKGAPGTKIKLKQWQDDLLGQVNQLVFTPVSHPSIVDYSKHHKSFFVTNGELEEEVSVAIDSFNKDWVLKNKPEYKVEVYVRGKLFEMARKLRDNFLPPQVEDFQTLIEFYLEDGTGVLDKEKFSKLLFSLFGRTGLNPREQREMVCSAALLVSLATSKYSNKDNHYALIEAWGLFLFQLFWFVETHKLKISDFQREYDIAFKIILNETENLWEEIKNRTNFLVGNALEDAFFNDARMTLLMGSVSWLGMHYIKSDPSSQSYIEIQTFILKNLKKCYIWGESAFPAFLSIYWFYRMTDATQKPEKIIKSMLVSIINTVTGNNRLTDASLPSPYFSIDKCLEANYSNSKDLMEIRYCRYESNYLEALVHLICQMNYKQFLKLHWPTVSKFKLKEFVPANVSDKYLWKIVNGKELTKIPKPRKEWEELRHESFEINEHSIPYHLRSNGLLIPLFLMVLPHRGSPDIIKFFESWAKVSS